MCMFVKSVRCHASIRNALAKVSCKATKKSTNRHCQSPICLSFALGKNRMQTAFLASDKMKCRSNEFFCRTNFAERRFGFVLCKILIFKLPMRHGNSGYGRLASNIARCRLKFEHLHAFARFILTTKTSSRSIFPQEACPNTKKEQGLQKCERLTRHCKINIAKQKTAKRLTGVPYFLVSLQTRFGRDGFRVRSQTGKCSLKEFYINILFTNFRMRQ